MNIVTVALSLFFLVSCNEVNFSTNCNFTSFLFIYFSGRRVTIKSQEVYLCYCYTISVTLCYCILKPRAGCGVVRIDPLRFLAGCHTRRLNQVQFVFYILACFNCIIAYQDPFYVQLISVGMCSLFWFLIYHYLPSD